MFGIVVFERWAHGLIEVFEHGQEELKVGAGVAAVEQTCRHAVVDEHLADVAGRMRVAPVGVAQALGYMLDVAHAAQASAHSHIPVADALHGMCAMVRSREAIALCASVCGLMGQHQCQGIVAAHVQRCQLSQVVADDVVAIAARIKAGKHCAIGGMIGRVDDVGKWHSEEAASLIDSTANVLLAQPLQGMQTAQVLKPVHAGMVEDAMKNPIRVHM